MMEKDKKMYQDNKDKRSSVIKLTASLILHSRQLKCRMMNSMPAIILNCRMTDDPIYFALV